MKFTVAAAFFVTGLLALSAAMTVAHADPIDAAVDAFIAEDYAAALKLAQPLAENGDPDAQSMMGDLYRIGVGVPQDYAEGVRWYRLAAAQGFVGAQDSLCQAFSEGEGVPQDNASAYFWCSLAATLSEGFERDSHMRDRDKIGGKLSEEQRAEVATLVAAWKPDTLGSAPDIKLVAKDPPPLPPRVWPERVRALFGVWSVDCNQVPMILIGGREDGVTAIAFIDNGTGAGVVDTSVEPARIEVFDDPSMRRFDAVVLDGALQLRYLKGTDGKAVVTAAGAVLTAGGEAASLKLCRPLPN